MEEKRYDIEDRLIDFAEPLIDENDQLISIFVTSIKTAKSKNQKIS
jgi:hypothetical protein